MVAIPEASAGVKQWWVLVYRVPSETASKRVGLWRNLKRAGALYLQQRVWMLPDIGA
jgi:DNA-binding transcriptional regulator PaaX